MDSKQIDRAMRLRLPVVYEGVRYERIREYISWYDPSGQHRLSVVLQNGNRTYRVLAENVQLEMDYKEDVTDEVCNDRQ